MLASHSSSVQTPPVSSSASRYRCQTAEGTGLSCVSTRQNPQSVGPATWSCTMLPCGRLRRYCSQSNPWLVPDTNTLLTSRSSPQPVALTNSERNSHSDHVDCLNSR